MLQTKSQVSADEGFVELGAINRAYGGIEGGVFGGVAHGKFENDFDWKQLATFGGPDCDAVCRAPGSSNQCFPVKSSHNFGPPCGIVNPSNGCFQNAPTQTCALCLPNSAQPYCCPYNRIPLCKAGLVGLASGVAHLGARNPLYGGVQGGVFGGWKHGHYDNDINFKVLSTWGKPKCGEVCKGYGVGGTVQCYPVKWTNNYGPPCGIVNPSNGCFQNEPTQTCALCIPGSAQPYCCPYNRIPWC